jgi:hypothetical protein
MNSLNPRYDVICDPLDTWTVWDNHTEEPATFGGQVLFGLTEGYAVEVAKIMNELYGKADRNVIAKGATPAVSGLRHVS